MGESNGQSNHRSNHRSMEVGFPERLQYIISGPEALAAIGGGLGEIRGYRGQRLFPFKTLLGPLVPGGVRKYFDTLKLNNLSVPYPAAIGTVGKIMDILALFGLSEKLDALEQNQRLLVPALLELKLRQRVEELERERPFGWKSTAKYYRKHLDALGPLVDNLAALITMAWVFCPGIGEPEMETGFFNRFVFTANGGFIDLGHFFNCALIAYLYGEEGAERRAEETEISQRWLREQQWLVNMRERNSLRMVTTFLWGYATSTDTIEDRASNKLGIILGGIMRKQDHNERMIDFYVKMYPKMLRRALSAKILGKKLWGFIDGITGFFKNAFGPSPGKTSSFDINAYMKRFFDEYDAIDPHNTDVVPKGLLDAIVDFYKEKYSSRDWDKYTSKEWEVVIPQVLWERVVRGRKGFKELALPIKIQMKDTGELVKPYD